MKSFLKTISKYKVSTILNILGLAAAFSALYIIVVQVHYDLTYNKSIKDSERIFAVLVPQWNNPDTYQGYISRPMAERLFNDCPLIDYYGSSGGGWDSYGCLEKDGEIKEISYKENKINYPFLNVIGAKITAGNIEDLKIPNSCAISQSFAKQNNLEIGSTFYETIKPNPKYLTTVKVIYKDIKGNNDFAGTDQFYDLGQENVNNWSNWNYTYFVKIKKGVDISTLTNYLHNEQRKIISETGENQGEKIEEVLNKAKIKLVSLRESIFNKDSLPLKKSSKSTVYTLLSLAILVVIIALINFINFFFALVPIRIRSVNTRKIFGDSDIKLRLSFIIEALGIIFLALLISYITVFFLKETYLAECISCSIKFSNNLFSLIVTILSGVLIALVGSIYPAYYITSFPAAMVLKGGFSATKSGQILRNSLISLQFIISITLIISAIFIKVQYNYMLCYDLGFNKENVLSVVIPNKLVNSIEARNTLKNKILENKTIEDVTYLSRDLVANGRMSWGRNFKGNKINVMVTPVSWNFLKFMGIEIEEGRDFLPEDELKLYGTMIINRKAANEYQMDVNNKFTGHSDDGEAEIVGISSNFNYMSLLHDIKPFIFYVYGTDPWEEQNNLYFRTSKGTNIPKAIDYVKETINQLYPDMPVNKLNVKLFDEQLAKNYDNIEKVSYLISFFTILSILISLMGVFGLVMFETQFRKKEIGVRRVHGANIIQILNIFNAKYFKLVIICFIISAPLSYIIILKWLETFAYRSSIHWWIFALSLIIILSITLTIVTLRSLSSACDNPINSLKNNE